jgi:hypothetical protein
METYTVKNLLKESVYIETLNRVEKLRPDSARKWGTMSVGQMMLHCVEGFRIPLSEKRYHRKLFFYLIGWYYAPLLYNDQPWKQNMRTGKNFIIQKEPDFDQARLKLLSTIQTFYQNRASRVHNKIHPLFGKFSSEQWGRNLWKHLDHHLRQFGV